MTSAVEQFVSDYTVVIDNDIDLYNEVKDIVTSREFNVITISDELREQYEEAIDSVLANSDADESILLLMRQILSGYGSSAFDKIAVHYVDTFQK